MSNTWKVGDEFWVDYDTIESFYGDGITLNEWKGWFPERKQPFKVIRIVNHRNFEIEEASGYQISEKLIYNKSMIINQILKEI